jgi:hypothetical protein
MLSHSIDMITSSSTSGFAQYLVRHLPVQTFADDSIACGLGIINQPQTQKENV